MIDLDVVDVGRIYVDGAFIPESEKEANYLEDYERYARGGRVEVRCAQRGSNGTFLPRE